MLSTNTLFESRYALLLPATFWGIFSCGVVLTLGLSRTVAITSKKVSMKYYQTYELDDKKEKEGKPPQREPEYLLRISQHVENIFETPVVFYFFSTALFLVGDKSSTTISLAWGWFIARLLHSFVHITYNRVDHRFYTFATSLVCLLTLGFRLASQILSA
jgi:hypothetical protein